jgi:hypothetical protein
MLTAALGDLGIHSSYFEKSNACNYRRKLKRVYVDKRCSSISRTHVSDARSCKPLSKSPGVEIGNILEQRSINDEWMETPNRQGDVVLTEN